MSTQRIPWPRVLIEGVVIVGSILLAFGIDAWWDAREDRGDERAHLLALDSDLTESIVLIEVSDERFVNVRSSLRRLLDSDVIDQPSDSIAAWAEFGLWGLAEYEPRISSLADLEASGQFGLLAPDVRRQVSAVKRALESLGVFQRNIRSIQENLLDPFLMDELPIGPALTSTLEPSVPVSTPDASEWSPLTSGRWRNRLLTKLRALQNTAARRSELRDELVLLQGLVAERLAELN